MKCIPLRLESVLLKIRVSKGYSQTYVAQHLGVSQKVYSKIESGKCKLDLIRFLKIAECLETHPMIIINQIIQGESPWPDLELIETQHILENKKLNIENTSLKSNIAWLQHSINKKLDKILENHESLVSLFFFLGFNLLLQSMPIIINSTLGFE